MSHARVNIGERPPPAATTAPREKQIAIPAELQIANAQAVRQRFRDRMSGARIPDPDHAIGGSGRQTTAIRTEANCNHRSGMLQGRHKQIPGFRVPDPLGIIH